MKTTLEEKNLFTLINKNNQVKSFLVLGDAENIPQPVIEERINYGTGGVATEAIWGTLGWENNIPFTVERRIEIFKGRSNREFCRSNIT